MVNNNATISLGRFLQRRLGFTIQHSSRRDFLFPTSKMGPEFHFQIIPGFLSQLLSGFGFPCPNMPLQVLLLPATFLGIHNYKTPARSILASRLSQTLQSTCAIFADYLSQKIRMNAGTCSSDLRFLGVR